MRLLILLIFLSDLFFLGSLKAAERFQLLEETVHSDEGGENIQQVLLTQSNKVIFVPPSTWSINTAAAKKTITLLSPDHVTSIAIRFTERNPALQSGSNSQALREQVVGRYPKTKTTIAEQFVCYTASGRGQAFDMELQSGDALMSVRLAFVPFENGTVEFILQTPTEQFPSLHSSFSDLLNSFQINPISSSGSK